MSKFSKAGDRVIIFKASLTVNGKAFDVPWGETRDKLVVPTVADAEMLIFATTEVLLVLTMVALISGFGEITALTPARALPANVRLKLDACSPLSGVTEVKVGITGVNSITVNPAVSLPPGVVTVTIRGPTDAAASMTNCTLRTLSLPVVRSTTVTPVPSITILLISLKPMPWICPLTVVP